MQRVGKNWTGNDRDYVYSFGGQLLHETMASGNQDYVWLNGELVGVVTSASPTSTKYLAALDQIGTPTRLYGSDGKPKWAADYEAFGKATTYVPGKTYAPSVEMNIRFPGQYFDAETGMHYNWYRYYDSSTGRYIGPDPLTQSYPALNQGAYGYALSNPLGHRDPSGQLSWTGVALFGLCMALADIVDHLVTAYELGTTASKISALDVAIAQLEEQIFRELSCAPASDLEMLRAELYKLKRERSNVLRGQATDLGGISGIQIFATLLCGAIGFAF